MAVDRILGILERVVPLGRSLARAVLVLASVAAVAAAVIVWALFRGDAPDGGGLVAAVVASVAVCAPAVVLALFAFALRELLEVPGRVRRLPETGREHAARLDRALTEADAGREAGWVRAPVLIWRLGGILRSGREALAVYAPVAAILSIPFLASAAIAAALTPLLALIALVVLIVAAF